MTRGRTLAHARPMSDVHPIGDAERLDRLRLARSENVGPITFIALMQRFGNHPFVTYQGGPDAHGRWWIQCACSRCGDRWNKRCYDSNKTNLWVSRYASLHSHGLQPVRPR